MIQPNILRIHKLFKTIKNSNAISNDVLLHSTEITATSLHKVLNKFPNLLEMSNKKYTEQQEYDSYIKLSTSLLPEDKDIIINYIQSLVDSIKLFIPSLQIDPVGHTKTNIKSLISKALIDISSQYKTEYSVESYEITRDYFHKNFNSSLYEGINSTAYALFYESFQNFKQATLPSISILTRESMDNVINHSKSATKKFIVTAVIPDSITHTAFYNNLKAYANYISAELNLLPMTGVARINNTGFSKDVLESIHNLAPQIKYSDKLMAYDFMIPPEHIDPLTRLRHYAGIESLNSKTSLIIAHSKQRFMSKARTSSNKLPYFIWSTGSISTPPYDKALKTGTRAKLDHQYGALIIELDDNNKYYVRSVTTDPISGTFYDLDNKIANNEVSKTSVPAIVLGDIHVGYEDPIVMNNWYELINKTKPTKIFIHDIFNGTSINHHEEMKVFTQAKRDSIMDTLEKELSLVNTFLRTISREFSSTHFYIVASNHDEFLNRYLEAGKFITDRFNVNISLELATYLSKGLNPIEHWLIKHYGGLSNVTFLSRNSSLKVLGYECALHGDRGIHGARMGMTTRKELGKVITGHTHYPVIEKDSITVGTSTYLNMGYNDGPSRWMNSSAIIYPNSTATLIHSIEGKIWA